MFPDPLRAVLCVIALLQDEIGFNQALSAGYGMVYQNEVITFLFQDPFYPVQMSHHTTTSARDPHTASTMLDVLSLDLTTVLCNLFLFLLEPLCTALLKGVVWSVV